jgi:hypothetical protein
MLQKRALLKKKSHDHQHHCSGAGMIINTIAPEQA